MGVNYGPGSTQFGTQPAYPGGGFSQNLTVQETQTLRRIIRDTQDALGAAALAADGVRFAITGESLSLPSTAPDASVPQPEESVFVGSNRVLEGARAIADLLEGLRQRL